VQTFARAAGPGGVPDGFTLTVCSVEPGLVSTPDGFGLYVDHGLEALAQAELVVVPGRYPHSLHPGDEVVEALRVAHGRGATVASVCIGAFVLGHAGLLDGRRATTHWSRSDELAHTFPRVQVLPGVLYVDEGSVLTSAGLAAGMDMCLHIVRREHGAAAAARLARWNVVAAHRAGEQAQYVPLDDGRTFAGYTEAGLGSTLDWAREKVSSPLTVADLARHACVSERTLHRRFRDELGTTPKRWLIEQRVGCARELLEGSALSVETIAPR